MTDTTTPMDPERLKALGATIRERDRDQREYPYQSFEIDDIAGCLALLEDRNRLDRVSLATADTLIELRAVIAQLKRACELVALGRPALACLLGLGSETKAHDLAMRLITAECALADEKAAHAKTFDNFEVHSSADAEVIAEQHAAIEALRRKYCEDMAKRLRLAPNDVDRSEGWALAPRPGAAEAFARLREAVDGAYDGVDADEHVRELRGTDPPKPGEITWLAPEPDDHVGCSPTSHCGSCEHAENDS